jgi:hypothetical protein
MEVASSLSIQSIMMARRMFDSLLRPTMVQNMPDQFTNAPMRARNAYAAAYLNLKCRCLRFLINVNGLMKSSYVSGLEQDGAKFWSKRVGWERSGVTKEIAHENDPKKQVTLPISVGATDARPSDFLNKGFSRLGRTEQVLSEIGKEVQQRRMLREHGRNCDSGGWFQAIRTLLIISIPNRAHQDKEAPPVAAKVHHSRCEKCLIP